MPFTPSIHLPLRLALVLFVVGCDAFHVDDMDCVDPILCYRDNDDDGLGLDLRVLWACPENIPEGYVTTPGDLCEDLESMNWNGFQYQSCQFENEDCQPVEYQGVTYEVILHKHYCIFAQDLRVTHTRNGTAIHEVTGIDNYTSQGYFRQTRYPEEGYLYGIDLLYPNNQICPSGWWGCDYDMLESSLSQIAPYANPGEAVKKDGFWENPTDDYWNFGMVPNGVFHQNQGYMFDGSLAAYWLTEPPPSYNPYEDYLIWSLDIHANDVVEFENIEHSWFGLHELRATRCFKYVF